MSNRFPKPGTVLLGKYRVESVLGEGGMGGVLKAVHIDLDEPVAIKVLLPEMMERQEIVQRFLREAKAAVKLKGEHVARVHDVGRLEGDVDGRLEGTPYIVMEFLDGADLNAILKHHGPQEPAVAVDLLLQACEAIAEAHSLGIIHRDIKASNFFITQPEGDAPVLKVLDFGIATTPKGTSDLTDGQSVIGTPSYMAPEQMRASRNADVRSDIWSLGVVLYELLEAARPFRADAYSDLCLKVGMDPPEPMVQPHAPEALRAVVMKCLEKPVERRYQSVAELAFDLMPFASDPVRARASVEQCARLLSRRGTRNFDISRAPDDVTPAAPPRLTPPSYPVVSPPSGSSPISSSNPQLPAADLQRTPTSVKRSNGEVALPAMPVRPARRSLVVVTSFVIAIALAGGGVMVFGRGGSTQPAAAPKETPDETAEPVEPDTAEPVAPGPDKGSATDPVTTDPMTTDVANTGSAATPVEPDEPKDLKKKRIRPIVKKKDDKKKPGEEDVYNQRR